MLRRGASLVTLALVLTAGPAFAAASSAPATSAAANDATSAASSASSVGTTQDQRTFVDVRLNGVDEGQALVLLSGNDVSMRPKDLAAYDVPDSAGTRRSADGETFVSLRSLAPHVRFKLASDGLTLDLTVDAAQFGQHDIALAPESGTTGDRRLSEFLNYGGTFDTGGDAGGYATVGVHLNNALFSTGGSLQTGAQATRGQTFLAFDDVPHLRRLQIGDSFTDGDSLVAGATILGITGRREFGLDPYAYVFPQPAVIGSIATGGTAQIYVNGGLTQTIALQPGVFNLSDLPVQVGANQVSVVVRDAQGLVQTYGQSYFAVNSLLRKGLTDYEYGAGFPQQPNGESYARDPALTGSYRIGVSNDLTVGAYAAAGDFSQSGDLNADFKAGAGAIHVAAAASTGASAGTAFDLESSFSGARNGLAAGVTLRSSGYTTLGETVASAAPPDFDLHVSLSQSLTSHISLSLIALRRTFAADTLQPSLDTVAVNFNGTVARGTTASLSLQQTRSSGTAPQNSVYLTFVRSVGRRESFTSTAAAGSGAAGGSLQYRLDPPSSDQGFGYSLQVGAGNQNSQGEAVDHLPFADVSVGAAQSGNGAYAYGNIGGGLVGTGNYVLPSRPIGSGFAVVDTGQPGVQVLLDNRPVGLSNSHGMMVVPNLAPYAHNTVSIDRDSLPIGAEVDNDRTSISPSYGGGTLASIAVRRITYISGRVRIAGKGVRAIPAYGVMMVGTPGHELRSALDAEGNFYFENLAPGRYPVSVVYEGGRCTFELSLKRTDAVGTDLGELECSR